MFLTTWLASLSRSRRRVFRKMVGTPSRRSLARRRLFERLEDRRVMASDWQNAFVATDVNNDRSISPLDVLLVINKLNQDGIKQLPQLSPGMRPSAYYDTTGDGILSPLDALMVINSINANSAGNRLTGVEALSNHYVMATFSEPVVDALMFPEVYRFSGLSSQRLEIVSVAKGDAPNKVVLATADQAGLNYAMSFGAAVNVTLPAATTLRGLAGGAYYSPADTAPRVLDVVPVNGTTILATYDRPMGASAVDKSNYKIFNEQGQPIEVISALFAEGESVVQLQTAPTSYTGYTFNIQNVADRSGQTVFFEGRKLLTGNPKGAVVSVASTSYTRVVVVFNEAMADNALAPQHYSIKDSSGRALQVTDARFDGPLGMIVILTTAPQSNVAYGLTVSVVTDLQNDGLDIKTGSFQGITAPFLLRAIPTLPTRIVLTYTGAVGDSALAPSTYKIEELNTAGAPTGRTLPITDARFLGEQRTLVQLTTASQADARYRITTTGPLTDVVGSPLATAATEFQGIGSRPALVSTTSSGPNTILMTFSEAMSDDALSPSSYSIKNATGETLRILSVHFVGVERRLVELTTEPQRGGVYTVVFVNATDLDGNKAVVPTDPTVNQFQGVAAPTLRSASPTDTTHLYLTFGGPVGDSALSPSSYKLEKLNAQGNVTSTLPISSAVFIGSQRTVVSLTTPYQSDSRYRISTTSELSDASGSPLAVVSLEFQGLGAQARVIGATSTGPSTLLLITSAAMSDDVLAPSAYVIRNSAGTALEILSAQFIGTERRVIQLTTTPQSSSLYTILSIAANDLSGNPLAAPAANGSFQGAPEPSLVNSIPIDPTHLVLTFGGPVGDSALAPSSYKIDKLDAQGIVIGSLAVNSAVFLGGQKSVVSLTTPYQADARYRISTTSTLSDATGAPLALVQQEFVGVGIPAKLVGATSTGPTTILMTFNVGMSDDVLSPSSYVIKNSAGVSLPVVLVQFVGTERRVIRLTTAPQAAGTYTLQTIAATDLSGNSVSVSSSIGSFQGVATPSLNSVTATDDTHIYLTFAGPVGDSALSPSSFRIDKLDAQGNVIGNLVVSSSVFVGDQRTVVAITTRSQTAGQYRLSTTSALTDMSGSPVPAVQLNFQGVGSQATLVAVSSTSSNTMIVTFSMPMSDDALSPSLYVIMGADGVRLPILNAQFIGTERRLVKLTTGPQTSQSYTVVSINATDVGGSTTIILPSATTNTFPGPVTTGGSSVPVDAPPRVVGAASLSNTSVLVAFSEPMADNALNTAHYFIVQQNVNSEVGYVPILSAAFYSDDHRSVLLTTASQNELTYSITALNVTDLAGNALAAAVLASGQRVDPATALFPGTPPSGTQIVDTDGDGLSDNVEVRGWTVTVTLLNGSTSTRQVTSDPNNRDADGDNLWDAQELNIGIDPRSADTDGDQLNDFAEFNEIYSDPTNQDSDGDSLDDFLEFAFFKTSPVFADTDGDQLKDAYEIFSNRNPRVSDLPRPEVAVGEVNLVLDVRFTETNDQQSRELETRQVTSKLSQSEKQAFTLSHTVNVEAHIETGFGDGAESSIIGGAPGAYFRVGGSAGYTFQNSSESAIETQREYESSLSTDKEVTRGFNVVRQVQGAVMQVAIDLRNLSSLAYRVKNLQVTAFMQDPQNPSRLSPVATLLPDSEPAEGFTLGALAKERGPFIFSNSSIIPSLVESLMANSSGLIFRISNYDIIDESGRNFAFTSQEIVERTSRLVIDYGGASSLRALLGGKAFDELQPGDETEIHRVATSAGQVIDTNFNGMIDAGDRRATFNAVGKEVGITLYEALAAVGLTQYDESLTPTDSLTDAQILASFSTTTVAGREKIFRIRGLSNDALNQKYWEILTPLGIDQTTNINELVLKSDTPVSLNFVQDLDGDRLSADVEFFLRTSDSPLPGGANVPGSTDFANNESVTYSTNPGFVTGAIVRVTEDGGGLTAGQNYFVRKLNSAVVDGSASFSFYDSATNANNLASTAGRVNLTQEISAGIFSPAKPTSTDFATKDSISYTTDPTFATATVVQVTASGGGLVSGIDYFVRNLGGASYSFYDSPVNATAGTATGRIDLTSSITAGVFSPTAKGRDTDGDGLDDRFESLIGWMVTTPQRTYRAYSSPNRADSNFDTPKPITDSDEDGIEDRLEYNGSDYFAGPDGWNDKNLDRLRDRFEVYQQPALSGVRSQDFVLDPSRKDTDDDGIYDATEIIGFRITRIEDGSRPLIDHTDPNNSFTDSDTFTDGFEKLVGLDPTNGADTDDDGDGLPDIVEQIGWAVGLPIPEVQKVTVTASGTFTLQYGTGPTSADNTTAAMPVTATARDLERVLNGLKSVRNNRGLLSVTRTGNDFLISFGGELAGLDQGPLIRTGSATVSTIKQGVILLESVSVAGYENGPLTAVRGFSSTDSVDTDGDGLTDFDEYFLRTDAFWKDTDSDGIDDRVEQLGFALGHKVGGNDLGFIRTNPLDADTDNDKRSDGAEAELIDNELARWIVRVRGKTPYQVFSNPLVADADFDGLVDGDEFNLDSLFLDRHTDPNLGNTDGDNRDDGVERGSSNPLAVDIRVAVVAESVEISTPGQYNYQFNVKRPDSTGVAGLSTTPQNVFKSETATSNEVGRVRVYSGFGYVAKISYVWFDSFGNTNGTGEGTVGINSTETFDPGVFGVPMGARFFVHMQAVAGGSNTATEVFVYTGNATVARYSCGGTTFINRSFNYGGLESPVALPQDNVPLASRSFSFGLANDERFSIEGYFTVITTSGSNTVNLGGLEGKKAFQEGSNGTPTSVRSVFSYIQVADKFIEDYYFDFILNGVTIKIKFYFIVG